MRRLLDWFDNRVGYRQVLHETLYEPVPGGARWRYVWGSSLVFTFVLQVLTGLLLWSAYSPSAQTAWESVYYIQHEMFLGNVVRGLHHYAAQAMVLLLAIHLMQVIIDGAYKAPREVNFWLGMILAQIVLALSLTGYLLPWDQKGYYATQVTTKIVSATPVVGVSLQELVQGGPQYGHHTLTRFFALHAGLLPALLVGFLALHIYVFRRHGVKPPEPVRGETVSFWPDQVLRDAVACLGVLAVVLLLAIFRGAELSPPANPSEAYSAARPEWYFLSLFRLLRFEAIEHYGLAFGAIYLPGAIMTVIVLMPLIAMIKGGHYFNVAFMGALAVAVVGLTILAVVEDRADADHQAAVAEAERDAHRAVELAKSPSRIPVEGAGALLQHDPFTQGPRLFAKYCASCHRFNGHDGRGRAVMEKVADSDQVVIAPATAPDLGNFGSRDWWRDILLNFESHFASATRSGYDLEASADEGMVSWAAESQDLKLAANADDLQAMIEYLVSLSGRDDLELNETLVERGGELLSSGELTEGSFMTCDNCHAGVGEEFVAETDNGGIPELNEYGSQTWLRAFIEDPGTGQFYGDKNCMPAFASKLSDLEKSLLVRFMTGDYLPTEVEPYPTLSVTSDATVESTSDEGGAAEESEPEEE